MTPSPRGVCANQFQDRGHMVRFIREPISLTLTVHTQFLEGPCVSRASVSQFKGISIKVSRKKATEFYYRQLVIRCRVPVQSGIRITNPLYLMLKLEV